MITEREKYLMQVFADVQPLLSDGQTLDDWLAVGSSAGLTVGQKLSVKVNEAIKDSLLEVSALNDLGEWFLKDITFRRVWIYVWVSCYFAGTKIIDWVM